MICDLCTLNIAQGVMWRCQGHGVQDYIVCDVCHSLVTRAESIKVDDNPDPDMPVVSAITTISGQRWDEISRKVRGK